MTYADARSDMRQVIKNMTKNGKDINEILDMPYHFFIDILQDKADAIQYVKDEAEVERILDRL